MKSPDHNGEDNFARDFMVSPSPCCCLVSPASEPTAASPARPGRQRFVCGGKETGGGGARQPQGPGWIRRLGGEIAPRPPFLSSCDRGPFHPRLDAKREAAGQARTQRRRPRPPIVSRAGSGRRMRCRPVGSSLLPIQSAPPGRVEAGRRADSAGLRNGASKVAFNSWGPFAQAGLRRGQGRTFCFLGSQYYRQCKRKDSP